MIDSSITLVRLSFFQKCRHTVQQNCLGVYNVALFYIGLHKYCMVFFKHVTERMNIPPICNVVDDFNDRGIILFLKHVLTAMYIFNMIMIITPS